MSRHTRFPSINQWKQGGNKAKQSSLRSWTYDSTQYSGSNPRQQDDPAFDLQVLPRWMLASKVSTERECSSNTLEIWNSVKFALKTALSWSGILIPTIPSKITWFQLNALRDLKLYVPSPTNPQDGSQARNPNSKTPTRWDLKHRFPNSGTAPLLSFCLPFFLPLFSKIAPST